MAEIIFQSKLEAQKFYNHMLKYIKYHSNNQTITLFEDKHIVKLIDLSTGLMERVKEAFYEFIIKVKRDDWFREILHEKYFYKEPEEQHQILDIIYSILEGQREDLVHLLKDKMEEPNIREAIHHVFEESVSFSFDSFLKFRLRPYMQVLERYVETAIDEYKMEQDYQMFVQMLREFLVNREPKMEILHLEMDEEITFFNYQFVEMKRGELAKMIDRKLLVNHPVYVDSASIAPLLSLAPTTIFIYTKNPDEPLVRTIKNIFEERVTIKTFAELRELKKWSDDQSSSENHA